MCVDWFHRKGKLIKSSVQLFFFSSEKEKKNERWREIPSVISQRVNRRINPVEIATGAAASPLSSRPATIVIDAGPYFD